MPDAANTVSGCNSLNILNFVAGHPCRFFKPCLISTASSREVFNSSKKLILYSPLSSFITVISAPIISAPVPRSAGNTVVIFLFNHKFDIVLFEHLHQQVLELLCDPPNCRGCINHPPPTACCSQQDHRSKRYSSISACTSGCSRPSYFCRTPGGDKIGIDKCHFWHILHKSMY